MKKKYEKPEIMFESFSMSTNIASGCEHQNVTHSDGVYGCGYKLERFDDVVFTEAVGCNAHEVLDSDGSYNKICYHVPSENNNLFTS